LKRSKAASGLALPRANAGKRAITEEIWVYGYFLRRGSQVVSIARQPISLETPIGEEGDSGLMVYRGQEQSLSAEATAHLDLTSKLVKFAYFDTSEEKILKMRFGIDEKGAHTLGEVGKVFDVTRERIRQIEAKALRKLRHPSRSRQLKVIWKDWAS
jgi:RNA polymerase primary sigma factor